MPGDRGLGDAEAARGVADGRRAYGQALDDPAADRVGEGFERIVTTWLTIPYGGPVRALFTFIGGRGHFEPLAPIARAAERLRDEIVALPGPDHAVERLDALVRMTHLPARRAVASIR